MIFFPFPSNTVSHCWDSYPSVLLRSRRLHMSSIKIDADLLALSQIDLCCRGLENSSVTKQPTTFEIALFQQADQVCDPMNFAQK
jgi:hypothetical protein